MTKATSSSDPYAEGVDAALAGKPETANPYDPNHQEDAYMAWNDGWASFHDGEDEDDSN